MTQQSSGAVPAVPPTQTTVGTALPTGRGWAYTGAILGITVSVTANIAHALIPTHPHTGSVLFAAFWPMFLFVAIEILSRVQWPRGFGWALIRFGGLSAVAVFAAVVSYGHLSGLLTYYGEDTITSTFGPLAVDGLMVMATGALIATSRTRQATPAPATTVIRAPVRVVQDEAATVLLPVTPPKAKATPDTPPKPDKPRSDTAAAVARLRAQHPDMTQHAIAREIGVSRSAVASHWKSTTPPTTPPTTLSSVKEA
jgi:hypothetical protein